jgi:hypothetical protein
MSTASDNAYNIKSKSETTMSQKMEEWNKPKTSSWGNPTLRRSKSDQPRFQQRAFFKNSGCST